MSWHSGEPHPARLANHLEVQNKYDDRRALDELRGKHVGLSERWMAELALGELDVVGFNFIARNMPKLLARVHRASTRR